MFEELEVNKVLIIAPKRVAENVWTEEQKKWRHLRLLRVSRIIGTEPRRRAALIADADVYVIGRDNVAWLCGLFGGSMLPFDMCVVDESSSFKNPKSMRFKALRKVLPSFNRVVILTGTPAPNSLIDLWSQIYLLDRGERLGKFITTYRDTYFTPGQRNGEIVYNYKLRQDSETRIHDKIKDICISMKAKDYLDLPERIDNHVAIQFPRLLQNKYYEFEKEQFMSVLESDGEITAVNAAALSNKLLQFANGAIYDDEHTYHVIHNLKMDAVEEIMETTGNQPILIAWTYRHDLHRLKKRFHTLNPRELKTEQDILDWNAGKIQMLLMHPASGGHGLNLQAGGNVLIWFGQTWSLELYQQMNARLDRQGQTKAVVLHHLVAHNTIEQDVIKAQARKRSTQDSLIEAVKARMRAYSYRKKPLFKDV